MNCPHFVLLSHACCFINFARVHNVIDLWAVKFALKYIKTYCCCHY
jgi:hypothetical protein